LKRCARLALAHQFNPLKEHPMKLGSQTGSVINHLLARGTIGQPEAKAGTPATILSWTDRHAATVFRVFDHKGCVAIETRQDDAKVVKGSCHDGSAEYAYSTNVRGYRRYFVLKDGAWREAGVVSLPDEPLKLKLATKGNGMGLRIGTREEYCDPSF
jgi:hypothetical protein